MLRSRYVDKARLNTLLIDLFQAGNFEVEVYSSSSISFIQACLDFAILG
jgi:hypothetical protein